MHSTIPAAILTIAPRALTCAAIALAVPTAALASPVNSTEFAATIDHSDVDLSTQAGADRLDDRIRTQINRLCRNGGRDSASRQLERECRIGARASVEREVHFAVAQANAERARFAANSVPASNSPASTVATPGA